MRFLLRATAVFSLVACADIASPPRPVAPIVLVAPSTATAVASAANLVINELMPDPAFVTDANGEWFEVFNAGGTAANLQSYRIASANDAGTTIATSVNVPAGGYVVLARVASATTNGGVNVAYAYGTAITLANATDWLALKDAAGVTVDSVSYSSTTAGKSWSLKDPLASHAAVGGTNWQLATSLYNSTDFGTPNKQNDGFVAPPPPPPPPGGSELIVRVLDVGQGDANYIENGTSKIMIDGGPNPVRLGVLLDSLNLNNTTINVVILSHEHLDHYSGLRELFRTSRNITVNYFFENKNASTAVTIAELRDSINARVGRGQLIYRDTDDPCANGSPICTITMAGGAKLHVMRPNPAGTTPNNRSAAEKLVGPDSAAFTMWLAGDAEQEEISWFLGAAGYATNPGMHVNVLKSDHHGSCNGVTNGYANTINPDLETMSVGATNTFGHIHNQTKALWRARSKPFYRTDQNGTITFRTPGTVGGGYTVAFGKGVASMDGAPDATSAQAVCNPIP